MAEEEETGRLNDSQLPYYLQRQNKHPNLQFDNWKEKRTKQLSQQRKEKQLRLERLTEEEHQERIDRVTKMREKREHWQEERNKLTSEQEFCMRVFAEYNRKTRALERSLNAFKEWQEEQLSLFVLETRQASRDSRAIFHNKTGEIDRLLFDTRNSAIARALHSEREALLACPLPKNRKGVDTSI